MESYSRTFVKTITWRIIAVAVAFVVAYIFTKNPLEAGGIAIIISIINMITYYIHERAWNKIKFGRR